MRETNAGELPLVPLDELHPASSTGLDPARETGLAQPGILDFKSNPAKGTGLKQLEP